MLQTQGLKTLDDIRGFLAGSQGVEIKTPQREVAYAFIAETLRRFGYARLGRAEKGLLRAYVGNGKTGVAVGTEVTLRPPHRSVHAGLPHTAPASGHDAKRTVG